MKKEYYSPEIIVDRFTVSSTVTTSLEIPDSGIDLDSIEAKNAIASEY